MRRWPRRLAVWAVLAGLVLAGADVAGAQSSRQRQRQGQSQPGPQLGELTNELDAAEAEESALLDQLEVFDGRLEQLGKKVAAMDARIGATRRQLRAAQDRLDELEAEHERIRQRLERSQRALERAKREMQHRAMVAYTTGPPLDGAADLIFGVSDAREVVAKGEYIKVVLRKQSQTVRRYRRLRDEIEVLRAAADANRRRAAQQRDVVARREARLAEARDEQEDVRQRVLAETTQRQAVLAQVQQRKQEFELRISLLRAESDSISALLASRQAGQILQPPGRGVLGPPLAVVRIVSNFGPRNHPIHGEVRMHNGIDLAAPTGTPIFASANGVVVYAGSRGGYGTTTIIDHGNGLATLYAHQSGMAVAPGDAVQRGQLIGFVGCTGSCTGPHLHFEVRVFGTPVDPLLYL
jgi:murein DD-endopeptidase MepM/ murein hydrolase activator NlpD